MPSNYTYTCAACGGHHSSAAPMQTFGPIFVCPDCLTRASSTELDHLKLVSDFLVKPRG